jgi:hypothetical protein
LSKDAESILNIRFEPVARDSPSVPLNGDVQYNLRILDAEGGEVISMTDLVAINATDRQALQFPADEAYQIEVNVTGIRQFGTEWNNSRNGIALGTIVVPEFTHVLLISSALISIVIILLRINQVLTKSFM